MICRKPRVKDDTYYAAPAHWRTGIFACLRWLSNSYDGYPPGEQEQITSSLP